MGRKSITLPRKLSAEIAARTARGESAATIRAAVRGVPSLRTLERIQRKQRAAGRPAPLASPEAVKANPPAPHSAVDQDGTHHALLMHDYATADTAEDVRAAAVALRRFVDPDFAAWLDRGVPVFEALAESDIVVFDLLREPADIAALARHAAAYFGYCAAADLAQAEADARRRAIALLEQAIKIVKESRP